MEEFIKKYGLNAAVLKWIAIISMLVDHTAAVFVRHGLPALSWFGQNEERIRFLNKLYYCMRRFGRLAFPIFCFFIVEGYLHTRNVQKYIGRLFLFAIISEFPFDYALHNGQPLMTKQNVYFTLLIGLLVIWAVNDIFRGMLPVQLIVMISALPAAWLLRTDYSYHGVFLIEMLYITRFDRLVQNACGAAYIWLYEGLPTPASFLLTFLYNGKRGRQHKYFFYWFYPLHLLVLGLTTYVFLPRLL